MSGEPNLLAELARVKAIFQQRAIIAHMGVHPDSLRCAHCGKPLCDCPDPVFAGVLPGSPS